MRMDEKGREEERRHHTHTNIVPSYHQHTALGFKKAALVASRQPKET